MNILTYDTDLFDRKRLAQILKEASSDANICVFNTRSAALEFAKTHPIDVAFVDLAERHTPGYFLAKDILALQKTNIIFTNYEWKHLEDAFKLRVSGYIRKPLRYEDVLKELQDLRYSTTEIHETSTTPTAQMKPQENLLNKIKGFLYEVLRIRKQQL